jgi:hypothetical protein
VPALKSEDVTTTAPFPVLVDMSTRGMEVSGSVRASPWLSFEGFVASGVELSGFWEWASRAFTLKTVVHGVHAPGVTLPMEIKVAGDGTAEGGTFRIEVLDLLSEPWMTGKGRWSPGKGITADFSRTFELANGGFDLSNFLEGGDAVKTRAGTLALSARFAAQAGKDPRLSGRVQADGIAFDYAGVPFDGIELDARAKKIWPVVLEKPFRLKATSLGSSAPLKNVDIAVAQKGKDLEVRKVYMDWAEGTVTAEPFVVSLEPLALEATIQVAGVQAETLLKDAAAGQIKAKGLLVGKIPLLYRDGFLWVKGGKLSSGNEAGWIQYKDPTLQGVPAKVAYLDEFEQLLAQGQQALAFKALDNFFFKSAQIRIERSPATGLEAYVTLAGRNPDLANGVPFEFSIGLTGQLENTVKQSLLQGLMRPEAFTEHLKKK